MPTNPEVIRSIAEARANGASIYIGSPCKYGHNGERYLKNNTCTECKRQEARASYHKDNTKRRGRENNRIVAARRFGHAAPPREIECRSYPEDNMCEVCRRPETTGKRLSLEHDHKTGSFRGWTCHHCNMLIGKFEKYGVEFLVSFIRGEFSESPPPSRFVSPSLKSFKKSSLLEKSIPAATSGH